MSNTSAKYEALDDPQTRGAIALNRLEQAYRAARENVVATTGSVRTSGGSEVEALVSYPSVGGGATAHLHPVTESYVGVPGVVREQQRQHGSWFVRGESNRKPRHLRWEGKLTT